MLPPGESFEFMIDADKLDKVRRIIAPMASDLLTVQEIPPPSPTYSSVASYPQGPLFGPENACVSPFSTL